MTGIKRMSEGDKKMGLIELQKEIRLLCDKGLIKDTGKIFELIDELKTERQLEQENIEKNKQIIRLQKQIMETNNDYERTITRLQKKQDREQQKIEQDERIKQQEQQQEQQQQQQQ